MCIFRMYIFLYNAGAILWIEINNNINWFKVRRERTKMIINPIVYDEGKGSDIYSKNLENRVIHLIGEVNDDMAASIVAQLLYLSSQSSEDIQLYINSPGGSVSAGLAIYDTMQFIEADVVTVCLGHAASMGAIILSGGTKGKRMILPNAEVMIHQPSGGIQGQASELEIAAEHIKRTKDVLNAIIAKNCEKKEQEVRMDMDRDYWMSASEAVTYGIVDRMIEKKERI